MNKNYSVYYNHLYVCSDDDPIVALKKAGVYINNMYKVIHNDKFTLMGSCTKNVTEFYDIDDILSEVDK